MEYEINKMSQGPLVEPRNQRSAQRLMGSCQRTIGMNLKKLSLAYLGHFQQRKNIMTIVNYKTLIRTLTDTKRRIK